MGKMMPVRISLVISLASARPQASLSGPVWRRSRSVVFR
jgi:hypothetical protein